jgi:hypothetical protein
MGRASLGNFRGLWTCRRKKGGKGGKLLPSLTWPVLAWLDWPDLGQELWAPSLTSPLFTRLAPLCSSFVFQTAALPHSHLTPHAGSPGEASPSSCLLPEQCPAGSVLFRSAFWVCLVTWGSSGLFVCSPGLGLGSGCGCELLCHSTLSCLRRSSFLSN